MDVTEAVATVFDFIDQLNCSENTGGQDLRNSVESRGQKRHLELDSQCLSRRYVQRALKRAAPPAGATTDALVGAAAGATALVGNSSVSVAARVTALMGDVPAETAMELGSAVGPTTVVVGNKSAAAQETTVVGKLSRKQAKNLKHRMNKMNVSN
jgi:hypothetical protein